MTTTLPVLSFFTAPASITEALDLKPVVKAAVEAVSPAAVAFSKFVDDYKAAAPEGSAPKYSTLTPRTASAPVPSKALGLRPLSKKPKAPTSQDLTDIARVCAGSREEVIKAIRAALLRRTGKAWSVTGGRGTAYGWIQIDATPARRTWGSRLKAGAVTDNPSDYERYDTGKPGGSMSPSDQAELAEVLGLNSAHGQGVAIPASTDHRKVYLCRALFGTAGPFDAKPYWD